jgi:hypothetical protein
MAHIDAGKTTVTERMLLYSGYLKKTGEVRSKNKPPGWARPMLQGSAAFLVADDIWSFSKSSAGSPFYSLVLVPLSLARRRGRVV